MALLGFLRICCLSNRPEILGCSTPTRAGREIKTPSTCLCLPLFDIRPILTKNCGAPAPDILLKALPPVHPEPKNLMLGSGLSAGRCVSCFRF